MALVTILGDCVQGIPAFLTLTGSTIVSHATISGRVTGTGYFYKGTVVDDSQLGSAGVVNTLRALGAIT